MKKILLLLIISIVSNQVSYARDLYEKPLPSKFKKECFEFSASHNFSSKNYGKNKININKSNAIAVRDGYLIPIIPYKLKGEKYNYTSSNFQNVEQLNDDNQKTFLELDTGSSRDIILEFPTLLKQNTFGLNFKHSAQNYIPELFVSTDGKEFFPVSFKSLYDFDAKSIKISFASNNGKKCTSDGECKREKIKINELSFTKENKISLIKVPGGGRVDFYSSYKCDDYVNLDTIRIPFEIDVNTPEVEVKLEKNKKYNPNIEKDTDGDKVENTEDNCKDIYNPLQKDSDADGIGDSCSDIDGDSILGHIDNCPSISNKDQLDINQNGVGDVCEFDKDKDEVYDNIDNCINVVNPFQKDSDKDGIGNMCDNCKYFNPSQADNDENGIGDVCDSKQRELAENDDDVDGIINGSDNCPLSINPGQEDFDSDGVGDACDNCKNIQNKDQFDFNKNNIGDICEDSDGDGIEGMKDNCLNTPNKDQKDSDNDGIGDLCEDDDNDKIIFSLDNCPYKYNPFQKDNDGDSIGDRCDESDDRILESNKTIFTIILLAIIAVFGWGIFQMSKKLEIQPIKDNSKKKESTTVKTTSSYTQSKKNKKK